MSWIDEELAGCVFVDSRLGKRLVSVVSKLSDKIGSTIPRACQDWSNTKVAYRFLSNPRLSELEIMHGHFLSTQSSCAATAGRTLILHDTKEMTLKTNQPQNIGYTRKHANKMALQNQKITRAMCGVLMHSSLAITPEGLPLGFTAIKFWNRDNRSPQERFHSRHKKELIGVHFEDRKTWWLSRKNSRSTTRKYSHVAWPC